MFFVHVHDSVLIPFTFWVIVLYMYIEMKLVSVFLFGPCLNYKRKIIATPPSCQAMINVVITVLFPCHGAHDFKNKHHVIFYSKDIL